MSHKEKNWYYLCAINQVLILSYPTTLHDNIIINLLCYFSSVEA